MNMAQPDFHPIYLIAACVCAAVGAIFDIRSRRIPNFITGPAILLGLLLHGFTDSWHGLLSALAAGLICFVAFLIFHIAGGMGAGDVKLMAAVGSLAGLPHVAFLLVFTALAGGVMGVGLALAHGKLGETLFNLGSLISHHKEQGLVPHPDLNVRNETKLRLPYGVAIAAGCVITLFLQNSKGVAP
jgi:prepilin peptidase CpaA